MSRSPLLPLLLALPALLPACAREERVVSYKPFFAGIADAQTQTPAAGYHGPPVDPSAAPGGQIVIRNEDGSVTLVSRSGRHLLQHVERTVREDQRDLFVEQLLSDATRQEYLDRGLDPGQAFDTLRARRHDIALLAARMPLGEHSPHVLMTKLGDRVYRVRLTGASRRGLKWTGFDMVFERGNWRLRWFVE